MKLGIVVCTTDAETAWNAFRMGVFALQQGDEVRAFLMAKGVECVHQDTPPFNVKEQMEALVAAGGHILACGTCLKIRNSGGSELCPLSTMRDLHALIRDCDKVASF
jgi:uncharacterized protein involved in oxidation of intracellular sulfur